MHLMVPMKNLFICPLTKAEKTGKTPPVKQEVSNTKPG